MWSINSHIMKHFCQWCNDTKVEYVKKTKGPYRDYFDCNIIRSFFKSLSAGGRTFKHNRSTSLPRHVCWICTYNTALYISSIGKHCTPSLISYDNYFVAADIYNC